MISFASSNLNQAFGSLRLNKSDPFSKLQTDTERSFGFFYAHSRIFIQYRFALRLPVIPWAFFFIVILPALGVAQDDLDDRFDSENKATSVRPSVFNGKIGSFQKIPYKITRSQIKRLKTKPIKSDDLSALNQNVSYHAAVLGRVESVYLPPDGKRLILNIGKDHRFCFKVVIDEQDFPKFGRSSARAIGSVYLRKVVLVNGLISQYQNLPQIAVTLPYQLEVVTGK